MSMPAHRLQTPMSEQGFGWNQVSYRLTLGWKPPPVLDGPSSSSGATPSLSVERFEVGGASLAGSKNAVVDVKCSRALTLFFSDPQPGKAKDARVDMEHVNIDGSDLMKYVGTGTGHGEKFSTSDINELSRRSGIPTNKLNEAWGTIDKYRLRGGLLQRAIFSRSTGAHEYLTVVPDGDWRVVELSLIHI